MLFKLKESQLQQKIIERKSCRVCNSTFLDEIISLGTQYLVNFLDSPDEKSFAAPLDLVLCNKERGGCGLLQLRHTVSGEMLYRKFWYKSGVNQTMRDALADIVRNAERLVNLESGDIVVDIGANDGTLLRCYNNKNLITVGFEPALNLAQEAKVGTTEIISNFFNHENFREKFGDQKAKIITSIAMFYDLEDPNQFVRDILRTLDKDGAWIIQMNYLTTMLENNAFDNVVHEHLEYYSLKSLEHLLKLHELEIFDVELNDLNGGSVRTYIKHKDCNKYSVSERIKKVRDYENSVDLDNPRPYHEFASRITNLKEKTYEFIKNENAKGKKVYVYGASTRGNTLLQFYNLNNSLIKAAIERNPTKWGKIIVGANIPIISEEQARNEKPDYMLILPWYFIDEFKIREKEYLKNGGKFIKPLPNFEIIGND